MQVATASTIVSAFISIRIINYGHLLLSALEDAFTIYNFYPRIIACPLLFVMLTVTVLPFLHYVLFLLAQSYSCFNV